MSIIAGSTHSTLNKRRGSVEKKREPISFIYFDLGKVVLPLDKEKTARRLSAGSGLSWKEIHETLVEGNPDGEYDRAFWDVVLAFDRGEIYPHEFYSKISKILNFSSCADFDFFEEAWQSMLRVDYTLLAIIKELRKRGIRTGVISDLCLIHYNYFRELGLCRFFDIFFFSFLEGRLKRENAGATFAKAIAAANLPSESILFVDDRAVNISAAEGYYGLQTHLYTNPARFLKCLMRYGIKLS